MIGEKPGDNEQVEIIADRIRERFNWYVGIRRLRFLDSCRNSRPTFAAGTDHVDWSRSDELQPPWPDLLITVGRLPSMVALRIKAQSRDQTRIVIVGRPRRWLRRFDLIVAPAHHQLPQRPNVVRLGLPLMRMDAVALATAHAAWSSRFAGIRRPLFALFVGGPAKPHVLNRSVVRQLVAETMHCVDEAGGSLWIITSPRTPSDVNDILGEIVPSGAHLLRWRPNDPDNPYLGLLSSADRFVVTGDSVSMLAAVARLGKPLAIYPLSAHYDVAERMRRALARVAYGGSRIPLLSRLIRGVHRLGAVRFARDVEQVHALLFEQGRAVRLGAPFLESATGLDVDVDCVVDRIKNLLLDERRRSAAGSVGFERSDDWRG